mmetsp:Transcript_11042/g.27009  ORF Transcript_11042/g.27009 Transcript_11042/m.27009 type:complete len:480 (+) Transcript_11042:261-1700(+)|eukprot:CAMPEP_0178993804 /NCGR_PEP_ID=MMETSP0795-20121207/6913_1 /TAXON_ID=88552 /ORGANISM="Amoebophrya sp., Strain Ameob2" /LENGTH=479 /DNA_ID=CAMNT_0020685917 /DNA_START=206 /DNA_END=1645 /DNA_ORIENTATION=-
MAGNDGIVGQEAFYCDFQYFPGIHPNGTPASMAGARVKLPWNEGVIQQSKGWGTMIVANRPHHRRPHLANKVGRLPKVALGGGGVGPEDGIKQIKTSLGQGYDRGTHDDAEQSPARSAAENNMDELVAKVGVVLQMATPPAMVLPINDDRLRRPPAPKSKEVGGLSDEIIESKDDESGSSTGESTRTSSKAEQVGERPAEINKAEEKQEVNPFSAPKELSDTLGGLIHARGVFQRRVARVGAAYASETNTTVNNSKKVLKIGPDALFIGDVDAKRRPHGEGVLCIAACASSSSKRGATTQHVGRFVNGRAHGDGIFLSSEGQVAVGCWEENKRVGDFKCLEVVKKKRVEEEPPRPATAEAGGAQQEPLVAVWYAEKYSHEGKKIARKKMHATTATATSSISSTSTPQGDDEYANEKLQRCKACSFVYHADYNFSLACRKHVANFVRNEENIARGIWTCCGARSETDPGCNFGRHVSDDK